MTTTITAQTFTVFEYSEVVVFAFYNENVLDKPVRLAYAQQVHGAAVKWCADNGVIVEHFQHVKANNSVKLTTPVGQEVYSYSVESAINKLLGQ